MSDLLRDYDALRAATPARLDLRRAGASPTTAERLAFAADHALARDAVRRPLNETNLVGALAGQGIAASVVRSRAATLAEHLLKPDLGRRLNPGDLVALGAPSDVAFIVADGLSSGAAERYAPRLLAAFGGVERATVVRHGRVAIGDEIGEALSAALAIVLIGERPGLSAPESLGIYVTYEPRLGRTDAERNCISNVRDGGTPPEAAAGALRILIETARNQRKTGVL